MLHILNIPSIPSFINIPYSIYYVFISTNKWVTQRHLKHKDTFRSIPAITEPPSSVTGIDGQKTSWNQWVFWRLKMTGKNNGCGEWWFLKKVSRFRGHYMSLWNRNVDINENFLYFGEFLPLGEKWGHPRERYFCRLDRKYVWPKLAEGRNVVNW